MSLSANYIDILEELFVSAANPENAISMQQYMRNQFSFLGIKTPERKNILKSFFDKNGLPTIEELPIIIELLWQMPAREFQYAAIEIFNKRAKKLPENAIEWIENLIVNKSWWDSVDSLAGGIGIYFELYPHKLNEINKKWLYSGNIWLQRSTLIFQLRYRNRTDETLLFGNILTLAHSKEFFIQKAIGWSLRQYARTNPAAVQNFVDSNTLPPLSRREALKYL